MTTPCPSFEPRSGGASSVYRILRDIISAIIVKTQGKISRTVKIKGEYCRRCSCSCKYRRDGYAVEYNPLKHIRRLFMNLDVVVENSQKRFQEKCVDKKLLKWFLYCSVWKHCNLFTPAPHKFHHVAPVFNPYSFVIEHFEPWLLFMIF